MDTTDTGVYFMTFDTKHCVLFISFCPQELQNGEQTSKETNASRDREQEREREREREREKERRREGMKKEKEDKEREEKLKFDQELNTLEEKAKRLRDGENFPVLLLRLTEEFS